MNDNKQIIKLCPNFYKIIEFNPINGDTLSSSLINMYHNYIFSIDINNEADVNEVKELDAALAKYIDDYSFRREVQTKIKTITIKENSKELIKMIINFIIKLFASYEDYTTRVIYISRWI